MIKKETILASLAVLFAVSTADAAFYTYGTTDPADIDGWTWEVYADGVDNYGGTAGNLAFCASGVADWSKKIATAGYSYRYATDSSAWSWDYEESNADDSYNDAADYTYFSGHGSSGSAYFYASLGDNVLNYWETYWGEVDVEAVAFDACNVLDANGRNNFWTQGANDGVHFILGFDSMALDVPTTAQQHALYLTQGYTHRAAWVMATQDGHPSTDGAGAPMMGAYLRFASSACDTYNDTLNAVSCDPRSNSYPKTSVWVL